MDFTDSRLAATPETAMVLTRLYIITTSLFLAGIVVTMMWFHGKINRLYPQGIVMFGYLTGVIFRAISWSMGTHGIRPDQSVVFSSLDYVRLLFFTLSAISVHLIPMIVVHLQLRNQRKALRDSVPGLLVLGSYVISGVILIIMIALAAVASKTPMPPMTTLGHNINFAFPADSQFRALTDAYAMLYWYYAAAYLVLLVRFREFIHQYSFNIILIINVLAQIGLTIALFLPAASIQGDGQNSVVWLILQYVFAMQIPLPTLVLTTIRGEQWVPRIHEQNVDEEAKN
ncbi:hypothetical protein BC940DRAFT_291595 [Gongronella butleri]|nr:hypothetical protein BC940DRAFT_291595 [Gongronella butleri]